MRYLRMLTNSLIGGAITAAYIAILVLQLNPHLPLDPSRTAAPLVTVWGFYAVHFAALFYVLIVVRQIVGTEVLSPGWISVRLLVWMGALGATGAGALMWANLARFSGILDLETAGRMTAGAAALSTSAAVLFVLALVRYTFGRRGGPVTAGCAALVLVASLVLPLLARGRGTESVLGARRLNVAFGLSSPDSVQRVVMILLDGGSLDFISPAAAEGRLPNFGKILDAGAAMHLATLQPTAPGPVWSAVATGKLPNKNGVRSAATYRTASSDSAAIEVLPDACFSHGLVHFGLFQEVPHTAAAMQARPLWSILGTLGISVGIVGWPLTHPVQPVRGYVVSDLFHRLNDGSVGTDDPPAIYPLDALPLARGALEEALAASAAGDVGDLSLTRAGQAPQPVLVPSAVDRGYDRIAAQLRLRYPTQFTALRFRGLDSVGHYFLRYALPREFGDVSEEERRRYGTVLEQYYRYIDTVVGQAIASLGARDLLLVVSGFGMVPLSLAKRLLERAVGDPELSGTHEGAPDGFLLAYGAPIAPGRLPRASVVDVAPTVLYFLGLPVGRDMDGYARTDLFRREFTDQQPITFIPTYDP